MPRHNRRHERKTVRFNVLFDDGERFDVATVENVSEGGLFIRASEPLMPGTEIILSPLGEAEDLWPELRARVVWRAEVLYPDPGFGMGVEFIQVSEELTAHVQAICSAYGQAA